MGAMKVRWTIEAEYPDSLRRPAAVGQGLQAILDLFTDGTVRVIDETWEAPAAQDTLIPFPRLRIVRDIETFHPESAIG